MLANPEPATASETGPTRRFDVRPVAAAILLVIAAGFTYRTIDGLAERRKLRTELAEISHVRYGLLNADRWVEKLVPILNARIDTLDLSGGQANLRPTVENALYHLLDDVKEKMSAKAAPSAGGGLGGLLGSGGSMMANMMIGALRPHVPEYASIVLAELGRPENREALKRYIRATLADGAKTTFGSVDMRWYSWILQEHGCADGAACRQKLDEEIHAADSRIARYYLAVLAASALGFALIALGTPVLKRSGVVVLLLFCVVLLVGGVLTPMIEVEAKISNLSLTFLGQPIQFSGQVLYFQSKSVLEVFRTLITMGQPEMWIVGVLVLMFSVVFPTLKVFTLAFCLYRPAWLKQNRLVRFFALESSKWSMADVMALAIFMAFVAFNGLIGNVMGHLQAAGTELTIPTNSSKILPGYYLFIGFCLASLLLSKKLEHGIRTVQDRVRA